jgi:hypothetical protein
LGEQPYVGKTNSETSEYVLAGNRLSKPERCPEAVFEVMTKCWEEKSKERPTMVDVHGMLQKLFRRKTVSKPDNQPIEDQKEAFYE